MTPAIREKLAATNKSEIARQFGVTPQAVQQWFINGIPATKVVDFCRCIDWVVTPHEIAPKQYPNPSDGLPVKN